MRKLNGTCLALLLLSCFAIAQHSGYRILDKVKLGGEGGWDYLTADPMTGLLFISRGTHVQVMDMEKKSLVGDIPNTNGVHGIALAHEFGKGYISDGRDTAVTVFDLATLKTLKVIKIKGIGPDAILYDDASKRIFTFNGRSSDATALDAATDAIVGTVALGGKPEFAQADGNGKVFVNLEDKSVIAEFDAKNLNVLALWPIAPGEEASGLAIDREHHRLFAVCSNQYMIVLNYESGAVVAKLPIDKGPDATGFDPGTHLAFSSNGEGTLTVVRQDNPDTYTVLDTVKTQPRSKTMALNQKNHCVYLGAAEFEKAPEPTKENPRPRPPMVKDSFSIIIVGR
jgi:DNA-binding beta-propeller fold protein YncE